MNVLAVKIQLGIYILFGKEKVSLSFCMGIKTNLGEMSMSRNHRESFLLKALFIPVSLLLVRFYNVSLLFVDVPLKDEHHVVIYTCSMRL